MATLQRDLLLVSLIREAKRLTRGVQGLPALVKQKCQELDDNFRAQIDPTWAFKVVANRWLVPHTPPQHCGSYGCMHL